MAAVQYLTPIRSGCSVFHARPDRTGHVGHGHVGVLCRQALEHPRAEQRRDVAELERDHGQHWRLGGGVVQQQSASMQWGGDASDHVRGDGPTPACRPPRRRRGRG